ncbi:ATP-binding cassette glutathione S-conjugate transporter ycf1, partial [Candidozyma auris]
QYYLKTSRELRRLDSVSRSPIFANFQESLNGVSIIRAYGQEDRFKFLNEARIDKNMRAYHPSVNANRWLAVRLEFLGSVIILASSGLAILTLKSSGISAGMVGLSVSYALQITQSLNWIVRMTVEVETNIVSVERVLEYSELTPEAPEVVYDNRPPKTWPQDGEVVFKNYSTRYRPELDLVLKNINLEIKPHEKIGIVGRTGAGKSSLTLALFRIIEAAEGHIEIDNIDTSKIGLQDLRHKLSIIPQDAQVFEGTIRDNLDPTGSYTDENMWKALELSHLKDHVLRMYEERDKSNECIKSALDVKMTEGGSNLSVGQRQLMCLARALLIPSHILVLDEATAAVDVETDGVLQETIRTEFKDRTILTIAHRLNTIMDSDRIVVLEQGEVAEFDSPEKLLNNKNSLFYSLALQGGIVNEEGVAENE